MTKKEMFEMIKVECANNTEIVEFCDHQIEILSKKRSNANSKKRLETQARAERLYNALAEMDKPVTFKEVLEDLDTRLALILVLHIEDIDIKGHITESDTWRKNTVHGHELSMVLDQDSEMGISALVLGELIDLDLWVKLKQSRDLITEIKPRRGKLYLLHLLSPIEYTFIIKATIKTNLKKSYSYIGVDLNDLPQVFRK